MAMTTDEEIELDAAIRDLVERARSDAAVTYDEDARTILNLVGVAKPELEPEPDPRRAAELRNQALLADQHLNPWAPAN